MAPQRTFLTRFAITDIYQDFVRILGLICSNALFNKRAVYIVVCRVCIALSIRVFSRVLSARNNISISVFRIIFSGFGKRPFRMLNSPCLRTKNATRFTLCKEPVAPRLGRAEFNDVFFEQAFRTTLHSGNPPLISTAVGAVAASLGSPYFFGWSFARSHLRVSARSRSR